VWARRVGDSVCCVRACVCERHVSACGCVCVCVVRHVCVWWGRVLAVCSLCGNEIGSPGATAISRSLAAVPQLRKLE
jgi:hypothetical protein